MVSDSAAIGVSSSAGIEEREYCNMHDGDNVGQGATDRLVRSRAKVVVNPFVEGVSLMKLAHKVVTHFSYSNWLDILHGLVELTKVPKIRIQVDLNGIRIAAQHSIFLYLIRLHQSLKIYQLKESSCPFSVSDVQWKQIADIEGVLKISQTLANMAHFERPYNTAYVPFIKRFVYERLVANIIRVVDLKNVMKAPILPRLSTDVGYLTMICATFRNQSILEFECRLLVNKTEVPFATPGEVEINN